MDSTLAWMCSNSSGNLGTRISRLKFKSCAASSFVGNFGYGDLELKVVPVGSRSGGHPETLKTAAAILGCNVALNSR